MAISHVAGFPVNSTSATGVTTATRAITTVTIGDLLIVTGRTSGTTVTVLSVSGGNAGGWQKVIDLVDATNNVYVYMWIGVVSSVGAGTVTVTTSAATVNNLEVAVDSFTAGLGSTTVWGVDTTGSISNASSTSITYPSLTPDSAGEMYYGYERVSSTGVAGSTAGYTYEVLGTTGNLECYNASVTSGAATQPTATQTSAGTSTALAAVFSALPPADNSTQPAMAGMFDPTLNPTAWF